MAAAPYAVPVDLRRLLCPDEQRTAGTAASLSDADLRDRIATAAAEVDSALAGGGYQVPADGPVPTLVRDVTVAVAAWLADLTYRQGKAHESQLDPVVQRYQWAQALLTQWARGNRQPAGVVAIIGGPGGGSNELTVGAPINPNGNTVLLTAPPGGAGWADADPLYDPDRYRWGHDRGWL